MFSRTRRNVLFSLGLLASSLLPQAAGAYPETETAAADGDRYAYDIVRNGDRVGRHDITVETLGEVTRVTARSEILVSLFGFELYRFDYLSEEAWDRDGLLNLQVEVNDDGERQAIKGARSDGLFVWSSDGGERREHPLPLYPTNHWNSRVLGAQRVLNTLTGQVDEVKIVAAGEELLELPPGPVRGNRYRYAGGLELESFYDNSGRWLGMRFEARDGSTIEYRCRVCGQRTSL